MFFLGATINSTPRELGDLKGKKGKNMRAQEIVKTWKFRIIRAGHTLRSFSDMAGVGYGQLASYIRGDVPPGIVLFDKIEGALKALEDGGAHGG